MTYDFIIRKLDEREPEAYCLRGRLNDIDEEEFLLHSRFDSEGLKAVERCLDTRANGYSLLWAFLAGRIGRDEPMTFKEICDLLCEYTDGGFGWELVALTRRTCLYDDEDPILEVKKGIGEALFRLVHHPSEEMPHLSRLMGGIVNDFAHHLDTWFDIRRYNFAGTWEVVCLEYEIDEEEPEDEGLEEGDIEV